MQEHPQYTLFWEDHDTFLATKGDDDIVGQVGACSSCLFAEILKWKYPDADHVSVEGGAGLVNNQMVACDFDLYLLYTNFDNMDEHLFNVMANPYITKAEWLSHLRRYPSLVPSH